MNLDLDDLTWLGLPANSPRTAVHEAISQRLQELERDPRLTARERAEGRLRLGKLRENLHSDDLMTESPREPVGQNPQSGLEVDRTAARSQDGFSWKGWTGALLGLVASTILTGIRGSALEMADAPIDLVFPVCIVITLMGLAVIRRADRLNHHSRWRSPLFWWRLALWDLLGVIGCAVLVRLVSGRDWSSGSDHGPVVENIMIVLIDGMFLLTGSGMVVPVLLRLGKVFAIAFALVGGVCLAVVVYQGTLALAALCRAGGLWSIAVLALAGYRAGTTGVFDLLSPRR